MAGAVTVREGFWSQPCLVFVGHDVRRGHDFRTNPVQGASPGFVSGCPPALASQNSVTITMCKPSKAFVLRELVFLTSIGLTHCQSLLPCHSQDSHHLPLELTHSQSHRAASWPHHALVRLEGTHFPNDYLPTD